MKFPFTFLISLVIFTHLNAQEYNHDIGVFLGTSSLGSDYGENNALFSNATNTGSSFAIAHYLQFYNRIIRWDRNESARLSNHLMIKTEFRYSNSTNLQNFGEATVVSPRAEEIAEQMKGSLSIFNFGINAEYYLFPIKSYVNYSKMTFNPFVSVGINYAIYDRDIVYKSESLKENELFAKGNLQNEAFFLGVDNAFSFSGALGTRVKLGFNTDIVTQFGYQYFFVDDLEGINTNVPQNTNNDWLINFQLGLVYRL